MKVVQKKEDTPGSPDTQDRSSGGLSLQFPTSLRRYATAVTIVAAGFFASSQNASSAEKKKGSTTHTLQDGETFSSLAEQYYGDPDLYLLLIEANPELDPRRLRPGDTIQIPEREEEKMEQPKLDTGDILHTIKAGESYARLAERYYGHEQHWEYIQRANPEISPLKLQVGDTVCIPDPVRVKEEIEASKPKLPPLPTSYTIEEGDNIFSIAVNVYGDGTQWPLLFHLNPDLSYNNFTAGKEICIRSDDQIEDRKIDSRIREFLQRDTLYPVAKEEAPAHVRAFIERYSEYAVKVEKCFGIPAEVVLAKAALETGWGESAENNNIFKIKATGWNQASIEQTTIEYLHESGWTPVSTSFRAYDTAEQAFLNYGICVATDSDFRGALCHINDPKAFIEVLAVSYATDPEYAAKIMSIIKSYIDCKAPKPNSAPPSSLLTSRLKIP